VPDETPTLEQESVDHVRIRFAGDSGDGMQTPPHPEKVI